MKKTITVNDFKDVFAIIPDNANKGEMGRVLLVCGSYCGGGLSMCGAAYFAAMAAYRTGAGIVDLFVPKENYAPLVSLVPEAVFSLYGREEATEDVLSRLEKQMLLADAVVIGCGLGKSELSKKILETVMKTAKVPLLIDADGLNLLSEDPALWELLDENQRERTVLTPHLGEMFRLSSRNAKEIVSDPADAAKQLSSRYGITCLMKLHETVTVSPRGAYQNHTGNPGMATAGMGDLLAGVIGALLARLANRNDVEREEYGRLFLRLVAAGAHIHGLAGDLAAKEMGEYGMVASDLLSKIPCAIACCFGEFLQN